MRMNEKRREKLYRAIHDAIVDIRIELKLSGKDDWKLSQIENQIWREQKKVLGLDKPTENGKGNKEIT